MEWNGICECLVPSTAGTFPCLPFPVPSIPRRRNRGDSEEVGCVEALVLQGRRQGSFMVLLGAAGMLRGGGRDERE